MHPPKPRCIYTWDVRQKTKYLDCLGKTKLLPLKLLSIKLAMLFALSCPERALSLAKLISGVCGPRRSFSFTLLSLRKRGSPDQLPQAFFASFPHETYVQSSRRPNQTHCLFLMSNHIIQSLRLL